MAIIGSNNNYKIVFFAIVYRFEEWAFLDRVNVKLPMPIAKPYSMFIERFTNQSSYRDKLVKTLLKPLLSNSAFKASLLEL